MGEVYRARDTRLDRDVALKVLRPEVASDPDRLRRFEREAKTVAALNHPHILTVHDVGTHEGTPYVVTELLEGETLRQVLKSRWLLVEAAWRVATSKRRPETEPLRVWADRIARRRGKRVAIVALARKLSGILYAMWRDGSAHDPAKLNRVTSKAAEEAA